MKDSIIILVLGFWFFLSILWQFKFEFLQPINKYDIFQLLPNWTFFAPNPGTVDYHLIYRQKDIGTQENLDWSEIPIIQNRTLQHFLWNPQRRKIKLIIDAINAIVKINANNSKFKLSEENSTKALYISVPYMLLMQTVLNNIKTGSDNAQFQFAVIESTGFIQRDEPKYVIISAFHTI